MSEKLMLIDGHSILNRAYYGVPGLRNSKGQPTNAVYGFLNIMFKLLDEEKPDYLAVVFDVHAPTFRHELYKEYKGTRKPMPDDLKEQVPMIKEVLRAMKVEILEQAGLEADDILGTLARQAEQSGREVSLVSGDRDLLQIASAHIKIRIPKTRQGQTEVEDYYAEDVLAAYHVTPLQFIDLKALMGDTADNIPGVPKVGEKTAQALMVEYGSLENIYEHVEEISKKSVRESLKANRDLADLSRILATIKTDCPLELNYQAAKTGGYYTPEAYELFTRLEFKNLLDRFDQSQLSRKEQENREFSFQEFSDLSSFCNKLQEWSRLSDCGQESEQDPFQRVVGMWLATEKGRLLAAAVSVSPEETFYCQIKEENEAEILRLTETLSALAQKRGAAFFDIKKQYDFLSREDTDRYFDVLIAAYLLNPLKSDWAIEDIARDYLSVPMRGFKERFGKISLEKALLEQQEEAVEFICQGAAVCRQAAAVLYGKLTSLGMDSLMLQIEMPLSLVLYEMEKEGVEVKKEELASYGETLQGRILELESAIYEQAGEKFNINSPRQLGEILFEKMKLPGGKKTKTGYSTAADVLEKLAPDHGIVRDVLEYRGLAKLKSTYADGLSTFIGEDHRIHTNFNQTITATGRISSTEPNLQNIPMRTELGRQIRKVFVPREGYTFVDADYSQIELRVLAHMSGDAQLIEAYHMDQDIHRITAAKVFHTPLEEVTDLQRRNAKAVNFGIVYGISSFGLSQDLSISRKEAADYINQYFVTYPGVKEFLDRQVAEAKEKGYVVTLFGRRRPVPELSSSNYAQRSFGERIAMNSPIQGTAADIIKIAMIRVFRALREQHMQSKLILQIHDELLIETAPGEEEQVKNILEENMKQAADLSVTLEVDIHSGKNWYEAK